MTSHKDPVFERWWPLPASLDLVRAPVARVADLLQAEIARVLPGLPCEAEWAAFDDVDALFRSVDVMTNVPTQYFALPTRSEWTVLWNNSFLCDGDDSLCHNLSRLHEVDTFHWSSSDADTTFQAGTTFAYRRATDGGAIARYVQCARNDTRWSFDAKGEPLPSEPVDGYARRIKRKRLNEAIMAQILAGLGAEPWRERFYDLPAARVFRLRQSVVGQSVTRRLARDVLSRVAAIGSDDEDLEGPPRYLVGRVRGAVPGRVSDLLVDQGWCGHGEAAAWIYEVGVREAERFGVRLPRDAGPAAVQVESAEGSTFLLYDSRQHPASVFSGASESPSFHELLTCRRCGGRVFELAVGFEVPSDASGAEDTSWFALAARCVGCGLDEIVYDDETA